MVYSGVDKVRLGETYLSMWVKDIDKGDIKIWVNPDDIINCDSLDVKEIGT